MRIAACAANRALTIKHRLQLFGVFLDHGLHEVPGDQADVQRIQKVGSFTLLLAMIGVFIVANLGVGFTFSTVARNQLQLVSLTEPKSWK